MHSAQSTCIFRNPTGSRRHPNQSPSRLPCSIRSGAILWVLICCSLGTTRTACIAAEPPLPSSTSTGGSASCSAGDLRATFQAASDGLRLVRLTDHATQTTLASEAVPLFTLILRQPDSGSDTAVTSGTGWRKVVLSKVGSGLEFTLQDPTNALFAGLAVKATVSADTNRSALQWRLRVENKSGAALRRVFFPQLSIADLGDQASVLFPRGPGEIQRGIWNREFHYRGDYPGGWCAMQFVAAYRQSDKPTGLYVGYHDPFGGTKNIDIKSHPTTRETRLVFEIPVPNMNRPGNHFDSGPQIIWQLFRGDWFDAATIYRAWARREARWWPKLGPDGRSDTPSWMREINVWVMSGGAPPDCVPRVKSFRELIGSSIGFHWYNWHQIPFDNDYPHYFPTKTNFAAAVADLQQAGVFVMPYINGRLWDSHDRGAEDFQFSTVALPATTKQENGQPWLESYGSKETNGQPVRLAVMCPATKLWQEKVHDIVLNLLRDQGTRAVYIDQIAAAPPVLCMDTSHGHDTGGGHWWNEGYWAMLDQIRHDMPPDRALTTECNGEPFIRWMDGYLTWHWQHDGQVPAFPAVYGGTIQMFGRAYRGGETRDLALRMKAAQQLVFGEQIGWFDPSLAGDPKNIQFLRKVVAARQILRKYFCAGEMCRPPHLQGRVPTVRADWQWSGEWWVTTDAILTGAWRMPGEKGTALVFVNVSDQPTKASIRIDRDDYDLPSGFARSRLSKDGAPLDPQPDIAIPIVQEIEFPAQSVLAWELN